MMPPSLGPEEGILYADVDRDMLVSPKIVQDFAGHYNRFDLLSLSITRRVPKALRAEGELAFDTAAELASNRDGAPIVLSQ